MEIEIAEILASIRQRAPNSNLGLGVAANYLKAFAPCLEGDDACQLTALGFNEPGDWQKALSDAESRMTYCAPDLLVKGLRKDAAIPGAIAQFDHIVTSTRTDRDGDVMEAKGAEIDENMPLLWHHNVAAPLGPYLGTKSQSDKYVSGSSAILDTQLGRDAAVLAEGGALRISNGFKPIEAEPIMGKGHIVTGFHVKRYRVMEVSLVSVPSNTDAVITSFSRKELHHPLVTKWAGDLYNSRSKIFPGFTLETKSCDGKCGGKCGSRCKCKTEPEPSADAEPKTEKKAGDVVTGTVTAGSGGTGTVAPNHARHCSACQGHYDLTNVPDGMDLSKTVCPFCGAASTSKSAGELETKVGATYSGKTKGCMSRMHKCLKGAATELKGMMDEAGLKDDDEKSPTGIVTKQHEPARVKLYGMSDNMEGSFQWITERLSYGLAKFMQAALPELGDGYYSVAATFADTALVSFVRYGSRGGNSAFYQINWEDKDGEPTWTGEPSAVKLSLQVQKKLASGLTAGDTGIRNMGNLISANALLGDRESSIEALSHVKGQVAEALGLLVDQRDAEELNKFLG